LEGEAEAMALNLKLRFEGMFNRDTVFQNLMCCFCMLFGLAMLAETQSAADGGWYWYSYFFLSGKHLYSDMHLALQPLFVLETSAFMRVLGKGWIVSKVPGFLHVVADCVGLLILVRQSKLSDLQKAIVLGCAFSISFEAYRFDDYHVLSDCFQLWSLILLLMLQRAASVRRGLVLVSILGVFSGLALTTRLNDGAALVVGVILAIVCLAPTKRALSVVLFCLAAGVTVLALVSLTGDSLHSYSMHSVFRAAGSKGGTGNVLSYPLHLPINTFRWLRTNWGELMIPYAFEISLAWALLLVPLSRKRGRREFALAAIGIVLLAFQLGEIHSMVQSIDLLLHLAGIGVFVAYGLGIWVAVRFLWWQLGPRREGADAWDRREILLLIPLGQLASGSMSSGGVHLGLYGPIAVLIVLLAICSPIRFKAAWPRDSLIALATLLLGCTVAYRIHNPFSWHTYLERQLFTGRTWYRHPDYGPMILDRDVLEFIEPVCEKIKAGGSEGELLSLPLPYANYFCSIPPWHGYVQTFFDTTTKETIQTLEGELEHSPPKWIFYQRQLYTLGIHESAYNQGKPLEHRHLDEMIEQKIAQGTWQVVYTSDYGNRPPWDNHWMLIRTR
jgi:hypothetical protein